MTRRSGIVLALAALLAVAPLGAARAGAQTSDPVIHVGTGPDDPAAPLIYADRAGLFKQAGLVVDLQKFNGSAVIGAALVNGSLDVAKSSTVSAVTAIANGLPFTIVGSIADYTASRPSTALLVPSDSPIHSAKDLAGGTLAVVTLKDQNAVSAAAWLDANGVPWKSVKFVEIPAAATLAALQQHRVAAAVVYEPYLAAALAGGGVRVVAYPHDAIGKRFPYGILIADTAWVATHRLELARFLRVVEDASRYVAAHEAEVVPMVAQFLGVDPAQLAQIHHPDRGVPIDAGELQLVIDAAVKYGVLANAPPARAMICPCAPRR